MTGPEIAFPDLRLERSYQLLEARVVDIPLAAENVIERFDSLSDEFVDPIELLLKFGFSRKIPHGSLFASNEVMRDSRRSGLRRGLVFRLSLREIGPAIGWRMATSESITGTSTKTPRWSTTPRRWSDRAG